MASVNKVILVGNVGRDPETRFTADGTAIANLSIATTDKLRDKATGEQKEATEWHRVVFFGKLAEIVDQYVKKGKPLYIEGKLRTRKWTDKDGAEKYTTEVVADQMQMLGGRDDRAAEPEPKTAQEAKSNKPSDKEMPSTAALLDDVPFAKVPSSYAI